MPWGTFLSDICNSTQILLVLSSGLVSLYSIKSPSQSGAVRSGDIQHSCLPGTALELTWWGLTPTIDEQMLPAISVSKGCCSHQTITLQPPLRWAPRALRMETECWPSSSQLLQLPLTVQPEETQDEKHRILAPDSWGAYQWNDFSKPRPLHLPIRRKALNSWTWDFWFSFINSNLLMFQLPGLCYKNPCISRLLPVLFGAVP